MPDVPHCVFILLSINIPRFLLAQHAQLSPASPGKDLVGSQRCICVRFDACAGVACSPGQMLLWLQNATYVDLMAL